MADTRRERARQQRLRHRTRAARVSVVAVLTIAMLVPSLRAPAPLADSAVQASSALPPAPDDGRRLLGSLRFPASSGVKRSACSALGLDAAYAQGADTTVGDLGPGHLPGDAVVAGRRRGLVDGAGWEQTVLLPPGGADRMLTLFACHPAGSDSERIVVRARALP